MRHTFLVLGLAVGLVGCAHKGNSGTTREPGERSAGSGAARGSEAEADIDAGGRGGELRTQLEPKSGNTTLGGAAVFQPAGEGVKLVLQVTGAPPGEHGAHIHEKGDCSDPEAKSAGGHWNPAGHKHGAPPPSASHLGDLGNIRVGADGLGRLELVSDAWKLGDGSARDVTGKALVIHAGPDDLKTDPAGNSGARIGCGVIR
jgi:superoxide dismutase, Cu-Zn family